MKVLVVDDSSSIRNIQRNIFQELGIEAETVESGVEALRILETVTDYKVIMLDINMPNMDGMETLKQIKTNSSACHIPVIMCSSVQTKTKITEALQLGAKNYIVKPFDRESFTRKIKPLLK